MKVFLSLFATNLAIPKGRHAVILIILIRRITPTNLPLAYLCLPNHLHTKLTIALHCSLKVIGSVPPSGSVPRCSLTWGCSCSVPFHSCDSATLASRSLSLNTTEQTAEEILLHTDGVMMPINAARRLITSASQGYPVWGRRYYCIPR